MIAQTVAYRWALVACLGLWTLAGCGGGGGGDNSANGNDGAGGEGTVTGTVVDAADPTQPIADAYVYVPLASPRSRATAVIPTDDVISTHTDTVGHYELTGVPAGAQRIVVEPPAASGFASIELPIEVPAVTQGGTELRIPLADRGLAGTVASVEVSPSTARLDAGQRQTFGAVVRDSGGSPLSLAPCWLAAGGIGRVTDAGVFTAGDSAGQGAVVATVAGIAGLASVTVGTPPANTAPTVAVAADATTVSPGDLVTVTASAADPDGDTVGYRWFAAGAALTGEGATVTYVAPGDPGLYTTTCVVDDGHGAVGRDSVRIRVVVAATAPGLALDHQVGLTGLGTGGAQFLRPLGMFVDAGGAVYVADSGRGRIVVFDRTGAYDWEFGAPGSNPAQFNMPSDVVLDSEGNAYVADTINRRIQVFNSLGAFVSLWGSLGSGDGVLNTPKALALNGAGKVLVADTSHDRIQVFDTQGDFVRTWGTRGAGDGQFHRPTDVVTSVDGEVYVVDRNNHRVQVFDAQGQFVRKWGAAGSGDGQFYYPEGIAVGAGGLVCVADSSNVRIQIFDTSGRFLLAPSWGPLDATGATAVPIGLALSPDEQLLYVSGGADQVQALRVPSSARTAAMTAQVARRQ